MIRVTLIHPATRRFILAQWDDPITGLTKTRSTKVTETRKAERFAAKLEEELNSGTYAPPTNTTWAEFCERFLSEVSSAKKGGTAEKTRATMSMIEKLVNPKFLAALADANVISKFAAKLRNTPIEPQKTNKPRKVQPPPKYRSPATIDGHLREVRKMLIWAEKMTLIKKRPHIEFPDFTPSMKSRGIVGEEFERMLSKVGAVVPERFVAGWTHYLTGLQLSGLRREESMELHWTDERRLCVDLSGRRPMMKIQAASDKGKLFRMLPITPDFAGFLVQTPAAERRGFVFNPLTFPPGINRTREHRPTAPHVGRVVIDIAKAARVFTADGKAASCHDFRRAFGLRWCKVVMPKVLQELMRHEDIKTTMKYYVGQLAEDAADAIWNATGNTFGNTSVFPEPTTPPDHAETT